MNTGTGDRYANGEPVDWPRCPNCGEVMEQIEGEPYKAHFVCTPCDEGVALSSCRHQDRYCTWEIHSGPLYDDPL